jgi:hypothetical protein
MDSKTEARVIQEIASIATDLKWLDKDDLVFWTNQLGEDAHDIDHQVTKVIDGQEYTFIVEGMIQWSTTELARQIYFPIHAHKTYVAIHVEGAEEINDNLQLSMLFADVLVNNLAKELGMEVI